MSKLTARLKAWLRTPTGHRVEIALLAYAVTELERRGYLPAIPIPKP